MHLVKIYRERLWTEKIDEQRAISNSEIQFDMFRQCLE